jgi:alpha-amylase/alpha-mannosidase (GH57 family)
MERFICVHGHFYQPPRENPWLETIEVQDSAYPYHDWNERVTHESYGPNAASRILDGDGRILEIVNNYARISFNFGPTLLAWMEYGEPEIYDAILAADRLSQEHFSGHGSAIAQVHSHLIMPLASRRDKTTQVVWGIRDFEHRFGRRPEGMWLSETAVDVESLDIMAEHGIAFTILAPHQAASFREIGEEEWIDVSGARIDPTRSYRIELPSGRSIVAFFYDGPVSRAVAFENLLRRGEALATRMADTFSDERDWPQIVHIATDGETYGHHHPHGEMALSYALHYIEENELAQLTNYGEYLERFPPEYEAEIVENTSWSCVHGVERWRSNCGCNTGGHPDWNQEWRGPLRAALDWLRDELEPLYEAQAGKLLKDPWAARDDYVDVVLDRSPESIERFFERHARRKLNEKQRIRALKLLEMQRHAILMYTSCGWFFDELSGIETVQVIEYAARAVQLADELHGGELESGFVKRLGEAKSNLPIFQDGSVIYDELVRPAAVDLAKVAVHYAMSALFEEEPPHSVYAFDADPEVFERHETGRARLAVGRVDIHSRITCEHERFSFSVLHLGDHNLDGGVRVHRGEEPFEQMRAEVVEAFERADFPETIRLIDRHFGDHAYSLGSLFRDEQRRITEIILDSTLADAESVYRHVYEDNAPLMRFLDNAHVPLPRALRTAAEFIMNADLRRALEEDPVDLDYIRNYFDETKSWGLELDVPGISFAMEHALERLSGSLSANGAGPEQFDEITELIELYEDLPFQCEFWNAQNDYWDLLQERYPEIKERAASGDPLAEEWVEAFERLGRALSIHVP